MQYGYPTSRPVKPINSGNQSYGHLPDWTKGVETPSHVVFYRSDSVRQHSHSVFHLSHSVIYHSHSVCQCSDSVN